VLNFSFLWVVFRNTFLLFFVTFLFSSTALVFVFLTSSFVFFFFFVFSFVVECCGFLSIIFVSIAYLRGWLSMYLPVALR
jgi:hypothetical protein